MVTLGTDSHKRSHTLVAVDGNGRQLASRTVSAMTAGHLEALRWALLYRCRRSRPRRSCCQAQGCYSAPLGLATQWQWHW